MGESQKTNHSSAAAIAASGLVILVCLAGHLSAIGLVGPDEPRYAWMARAMAASGDWITPRLYGQPWFEKPILFYWAAAIGFLLHLPPEYAVRLPSAVAAIAAALAVGWLGWKHYGDGTGFERSPALLAPLLFSTSVAAIGFARAGGPDMLFAATLTLAMASAASVFRRAGVLPSARPTQHGAHRDALSLVLFGAFLGLAALAKGPAALVLAGGAIGLWALATSHWRAAMRVAHPFAIAAFCAIALPWYVLCALRNPGFLRIFILQHNFARYLTPLFQHPQPFWFFGPVLLLALLPWTVLLWPAAREGLRLWRERTWKDSPGFFLACWALFPILFFSFSQSKLPGYILPSVAPLALLLSVVVAREFQTPRRTKLLLGLGAAITWLALALFGWHAIHRLPQDALEQSGLLHTTEMAALLAIVFALMLVLFALRGKCGLTLAACALSVAVGVEFANLQILPRLDPFYSARPHALFLRDDRHPDRIFTYHLPRSWHFGLAFYFGRELPEWSSADPHPALVLTTPSSFEEIRDLGRFRGSLDETSAGIVYVPILPAPR